jgi:hypothetical protein
MDRSSALAQLFVLLFVINTAEWHDVTVGASRVTLTDNGYKNLVVAISPAAQIDQSESIIKNIKVLFRIYMQKDAYRN